tara:strand:- start:403 stop:693 length:291 start_codon:yes stop_codon:yes gene_type:complete
VFKVLRVTLEQPERQEQTLPWQVQLDQQVHKEGQVLQEHEVQQDQRVRLQQLLDLQVPKVLKEVLEQLVVQALQDHRVALDQLDQRLFMEIFQVPN